MNNKIVINPKILLGKPVIAGTRIPVYLVLNLIAKGKTIKNIISDYPELTEDGIKVAVSYAAANMEYEETREYTPKISS